MVRAPVSDTDDPAKSDFAWEESKLVESAPPLLGTSHSVRLDPHQGLPGWTDPAPLHIRLLVHSVQHTVSLLLLECIKHTPNWPGTALALTSFMLIYSNAPFGEAFPGPSS